MKNKLILLIILALTQACVKDKNTPDPYYTFQGRVTYDEMGAGVVIGVPNIAVSIYREFETGIHRSELVGTVYTDANGYYTLDTVVNEFGLFLYYGYAVDYGEWNDENHLVQNNGDSIEGDVHKIVTQDIGVRAYAQLKFHIKNISPVNSDDAFWINVNADTLKGMNVDTIIISKRSFYQAVSGYCSYNYMYKKDGISYPSVVDSVVGTKLQVVDVNINY